eukprot:TRINITY_DN10864_c0_g1_i1.p2 TRINITY_DN10864_c0_g1~~TRINITY_DN10864_c0_g1_i1.p2  ORF type:complete len:259 (+),score=59.55 TRINITY_DN10864_c0_g1_i1:100-876(+)
MEPALIMAILVGCFLAPEAVSGAKPELRAKEDTITLQADRDIKFSTASTKTLLNGIVQSLSANRQNSALRASSLASSISRIESQTVSAQASSDAALESATASVTAFQTDVVNSIETVQAQLSSQLSTTEDALNVTVAAELATLEQLIQASNANLTLSLNDTVKITELETSLSNAITTNAVNLADNGCADASTLVLLQSLSTQMSSDKKSMEAKFENLQNDLLDRQRRFDRIKACNDQKRFYDTENEACLQRRWRILDA